MIYLPVSDMLWLSKEMLEYFASISSWTGRLVKVKAVRKRTYDYILLPRFNDYLNAGLQQLKCYCMLLMKSNIFQEDLIN